jgi:TRAP-type C4-dicarboxylate transport system permease small subunit
VVPRSSTSNVKQNQQISHPPSRGGADAGWSTSKMGAPRKSIVRYVSDWLAYIEEVLIGIALFAILSLICFNVFSRFILGTPYAWPDEIATFLHILGIYIGVAIACRKHMHLRIDLVPQYFPKLKNAYSLIETIGGVLFGTLFVWLSYEFFLFQRMIMDKSWVTGVPIWIIALVIFLCGTLILLREIERLVSTILSLSRMPKTSHM